VVEITPLPHVVCLSILGNFDFIPPTSKVRKEGKGENGKEKSRLFLFKDSIILTEWNLELPCTSTVYAQPTGF
jgi:hypothetical protein